MPFGTFTANSKTFNQAGDGRYVNSTAVFGQPNDYMLFKGGSLSRDRRNLVTALTRIQEKDIVIDDKTTRRQGGLQLIYTAPVVGYTSSDLLDLLSDSSDALTAFLERMLRGES